MTRTTAIALCFGLAAGAAATAAPSEPIAVVRGLVEAFNDHDVDAMSSFVTDEVEWLSVQGAEVSVDSRGKAALREVMNSYFASIPAARSEIESSMVSGRYVVVRERAYWKSKGAGEDEATERSQSSLAVYELDEGRIARVWYYPAEK